MGVRAQTFPRSKLTLNLIMVQFGQLKESVCEKNALLCTSILAQKSHFWSPERLFLAKNMENKVFSVHTIQNLTFWNPNVAPRKVENLGPTDPPLTPSTLLGSGG